MQCPNCGHHNEPGNRFCINCAQALPAEGLAITLPSVAESYAAGGWSEQRVFWSKTGQTLIALLALFLFYWVLRRMSFVRTIVIPDFPLTVQEILTAITYLVALLLVLDYALTLRSLLPVAYPGWAPLGGIFVPLLFVMANGFAYRALAPLLFELADDGDAIPIIQLLLLVIALGILASAWLSLYQSLPGWLARLRLDPALTAAEQVACLNCGRLNAVSSAHWRHCSQPLPGRTGSAA